MNKNKEVILIAKIILSIGLIVATVVFPPTILIVILSWAGWIVFNNYMDTR